ncbi:tRNA lysidine(34) synthetase TilS [Alkalihalobacillus sp. MEB130]|uniref:tRNA lysidine(34) synthetase TilS n=1 Tax=Alkalihalobacillus sp. MEB130 TaxID=2976704 RepID=UPI0028E03C98|nr:tRNA lysidine(34) synthetase TilS [Alkalihalobacillus sp. MEB130]MDT8862663.1 tRNA lysidine(34) synthetase TilS [Alkalihalobacillus sp. MEB130]
MKQDVHKFMNRHQLLQPYNLIIVAVSGGPDSMALLHYLWIMRDKYEIKVAACHVHHQLRGVEADEDADYVERFCEERGIPFHQKRVNVKAYAAKHNLGTQVAARELRYRFFEELLQQYPNSAVATGHHGDDQVETVLMKMARGSLPLYTYGIPVKRQMGEGAIIRPLLGITKDEIEQYCIEAFIHPRRDSSNNSSTYTRNRFRQEVLPFFKNENPVVHTHMQRKTEWETDDHDLLMKMAHNAQSNIIMKKSERNVTISRNSLLEVAVPLQRRVIHLILNYLYGKNSPLVTSIHIEQVLDMLYQMNPSARLDFPGAITILREYDLCHFRKEDQAKKKEEKVQALPVPGTISTTTWIIESYVTEEPDIVEEDNQIVLDYDGISQPLVVRNKQPSDRMACRGMKGTKKVGRLFIDRKISLHERSQWPIIVDSSGEILWVPFLHRSKVGHVGHDTKKRLVLTCFRSNEEAGPDK